MQLLSGMEAAIGIALVLVVWAVYRFHISNKYPHFTFLDLVMYNGRFDKWAFWYSVWNVVIIFFLVYMSREHLITEGYLTIILAGAFGPLVTKVLKGSPIVSHKETVRSSETEVSTATKL